MHMLFESFVLEEGRWGERGLESVWACETMPRISLWISIYKSFVFQGWMLDYEEDKGFWDIGSITETAHKIICSFHQAMRLLCVLIDFNYLCFIQCCAILPC
jgi:hypothetical protein